MRACRARRATPGSPRRPPTVAQQLEQLATRAHLLRRDGRRRRDREGDAGRPPRRRRRRRARRPRRDRVGEPNSSNRFFSAVTVLAEFDAACSSASAPTSTHSLSSCAIRNRYVQMEAAVAARGQAPSFSTATAELSSRGRSFHPARECRQRDGGQATRRPAARHRDGGQAASRARVHRRPPPPRLRSTMVVADVFVLQLVHGAGGVALARRGQTAWRPRG